MDLLLLFDAVRELTEFERFMRSPWKMFIAGSIICGIVGLVVGHINGFLHARGTIYRWILRNEIPDHGSARFERKE